MPAPDLSLLVYCRDDSISSRWVGINAFLSELQCDQNIFTLAAATQWLLDNYAATVSLASISQPSPTTLLFTFTDASTQGPFTLPTTRFRSRGDWVVATAYLENDTFIAPDGGTYLVTWPHTSDPTSFDPNANDGLGHDFYAPMVPPRGNMLPAGGTVAMFFRKNSSTDYDANWAFIKASEVLFFPSTGSALISDNVADAIEELEILISTAGVGTFLPLSGGTMSGAIELAADPASAMQAATKQYVDGLALNLGKRGRVRAATTANITIATALNNGDTLDGVTLATDDLVLVKNQSSAAENGVYVVGVTPARTAEFDSYDEHPGSLLAVEEGSTNTDTIWLCTSNAGGTLNSTAIAFSQLSVSGALLAANNLSDVVSVATARSSLGLGTGDSPQFTAINVGHASDTTVTRDSAGVIAVEGVPLYSNIPQNSKSAAYTTVLADAQKHILHPSADTTARNFTIDSNANVAYPIGTAITFINQHSGGVITIKITTDTMRLAGTGATGDRTLAADGIATAIKITSTEWIISGTGLT